MKHAYTVASIFFPEGQKIFFDGKHGEDWKDSVLFKQEERGQSIPDRRGYRSGRYRDPEFFQELDDIRKECVVDNKYLADLFPSNGMLSRVLRLLAVSYPRLRAWCHC